jgi:gamma-polyglutamate biosynthesis protein CapA
MKRNYAGILGLVLIGVTAFGLILYIAEPRVTYEKKIDPVVEEPKEKILSLLFVGDIMLDRGVRIAIAREGSRYPFEGVKDIFQNHNLVLGNLEGGFTTNSPVALPGTGILRFTFDPSLAQMLREYNFSGFSLANNHTFDFGRKGFDNTRETLTANGFFHFGSPSNDLDISSQILIEEENICFIGYHSLYREDTAPIINKIQELRVDCDFIIVSAHWGDEYQDEENVAQRRQGRSFIEAGADLVIGHHPHVVQPIEIYKNKVIFYSLGNFLFDQDFSLATRQGLAVRLELTKTKQRFNLVPIEMSRARLYHPTSESYLRAQQVIVSKLPPSMRTSVETMGYFEIER